ncbi:hypothetical protein MLD38_008273 [Melastoma candidum]|uniref:Uncharacterized protein n=1 Tax=Melastoma candidum TaxID=119954 RepID=A0ACB9RV22_9MYRT|nr:hypothetical protein MLD38_008273 [Melastoma candidum]
MAPKRKARAVVRTTKKVVEETVQVHIIDDSERADEIVAEAGFEIGKEDAGDEVLRTTVIVGGGETERAGEGGEKRSRVEIPIEGQSLEEPAVVTPRKEPEKRGADGREKEPANVVEVRREDVSGDVEKVTAGKTQDEVWIQEAEGSDDTGEETEEPETEKGDKEGAPKQGMVMTPEKREVRKARERDDGAERGETKSTKGRRRRKGGGISRSGGETEQYKRYVYRVLKQVHPELGISSAAMEVVNAYMNDMFERLADEAAKLSRYTEKKTLSSREVQSAVRLVLPGELGRHAIAEGAKAVTNYMSYGVVD